MTMPLSGMVCYLLAGTCCGQSPHEIWSLYIHPLWR